MRIVAVAGYVRLVEMLLHCVRDDASLQLDGKSEQLYHTMCHQALPQSC